MSQTDKPTHKPDRTPDPRPEPGSELTPELGPASGTPAARDASRQTGHGRAERGAAWLAAANVRPTRQRVLLANLLVGDGQHRHVTAESLYDAVRQSGERVALATVYNTLRAFSEAGLLREITVNGARSYFDTDTSNHAHFYWEDTGDLADAGHDRPEHEVQVSNLPAPPAGMEISKVDVVIRLKRR